MDYSNFITVKIMLSIRGIKAFYQSCVTQTIKQVSTTFHSYHGASASASAEFI